MKTAFDLVVMGDINLDYVVTDFLPYEFEKISSNQLLFSNIQENDGGSGLIFCSKSEFWGYSSLLLSKVGNDIAGETIVDLLRNKPLISLPKSLVSSRPTGRAIIIRDSKKVRLLINNDDNANYQLNPKDIANYINEISSCKVLHISGYCINKKDIPRFQATKKAISYANSSKTNNKPVIVFDVVPHRIYNYFSFNEFLKITSKIDILVSEVATIRRFLGLGEKSEIIDENLAQETLEKINKYYNRLVLRFGPSGCDQQILWDKNNNKYHYSKETGHRFLTPDEQRGFGDNLTLIALAKFFNVLPAYHDNLILT